MGDNVTHCVLNPLTGEPRQIWASHVLCIKHEILKFISNLPYSNIVYWYCCNWHLLVKGIPQVVVYSFTSYRRFCQISWVNFHAIFPVMSLNKVKVRTSKSMELFQCGVNKAQTHNPILRLFMVQISGLHAQQHIKCVTRVNCKQWFPTSALLEGALNSTYISVASKP